MRTLIIIACALTALLAGCSEQAPQRKPSLTEKSAPQEMTEQQVLKELETQLKHLFEQACPEAEMTTEKKRITVSYRAVLVDMGKFAPTGIGEPTEDLHWLPNPDGFVLSVQIGKGDYWRELDSPEEMKSACSSYSVGHKIRWQQSAFIDVNLKFGEKADNKIIESIKQTIAAYAKARK
jgi:hypothetical protein